MPNAIQNVILRFLVFEKERVAGYCYDILETARESVSNLPFWQSFSCSKYTCCSVDSRTSHGNDPWKPHNETSGEKRVQAMWGNKFFRIQFEHSCDIGAHWGGSEEIWVFVMWEKIRKEMRPEDSFRGSHYSTKGLVQVQVLSEMLQNSKRYQTPRESSHPKTIQMQILWL